MTAFAFCFTSAKAVNEKNKKTFLDDSKSHRIKLPTFTNLFNIDEILKTRAHRCPKNRNLFRFVKNQKLVKPAQKFNFFVLAQLSFGFDRIQAGKN
jgi:hypothetical protein